VSRTAREAGIQSLYHYEPFKPNYLTDILTNRRVHCSDLKALNDPWDCRPWFDDSALNNSELIEGLIQWLFSFTPTAPVSEAEIRSTQNVLRTNKEYRHGILERFSEDFLKMIPNRWRIYCLTPVSDSTLMWSHYADNHQGVCLEFSVDDPLFGFAQEVTYLSSYPRWAPHSLMYSDQPSVLLTKSDDWQYEREYRIIGLVEGVVRPTVQKHPLILSGEFLRFGKGALQAIITGCEANREEIQAAAQAIDPSVKVKRAVRARSKYRIEIVE
jgi:hypothetical protein